MRFGANQISIRFVSPKFEPILAILSHPDQTLTHTHSLFYSFMSFITSKLAPYLYPVPHLQTKFNIQTISIQTPIAD